jgi:ParB family chromosome partitioning protein
MLSEIAGTSVAEANISEKARTQKAIIRNYLSGTNGRARTTSWLPRWMAFPARNYTDRGGFRTAEDGAMVRELLSPS